MPTKAPRKAKKRGREANRAQAVAIPLEFEETIRALLKTPPEKPKKP